MSPSFLVHCPHCHAEGNLADPTLLGQAISCPVCQQIFVAPAPVSPDSLPAMTAPATVIASSIEAIVAPPAAAVPSDATETVNPLEPPVTVAVSAEMASVPSPTPASPIIAESPTDSVAAFESVTAPPPIPMVVAVSVPAAVAVAAEATVVFAEQTIATPPPIPTPDVVPRQSWNAGAIPVVVAVPIPVAAAPIVPPVGAPPQSPGFGMPVPPFVVPTAVPGVVVALPAQPAGVWPVAAEPAPVDFPVNGDFLVPARPAMEGPVPQFMAPPPPPGVAEVSFAESLPEPVARGAVAPPKPINKTVQKVVIGTISAIVLFATVVFLLGDPFRNKPLKPKESNEMNPIAKPYKPGPQDESMQDALARIKALQSNDGKKE